MQPGVTVGDFSSTPARVGVVLTILHYPLAGNEGLNTKGDIMSEKEGYISNRKPLQENEVVIHVPKGHAQHVKVVEAADAGQTAEITVQVSKQRKAGRVPVLGVIVK